VPSPGEGRRVHGVLIRIYQGRHLIIGGIIGTRRRRMEGLSEVLIGIHQVRRFVVVVVVVVDLRNLGPESPVDLGMEEHSGDREPPDDHVALLVLFILAPVIVLVVLVVLVVFVILIVLTIHISKHSSGEVRVRRNEEVRGGPRKNRGRPMKDQKRTRRGGRSRRSKKGE
jgi:hypothetical protein